MSYHPRVAVVGAGIVGLSCALRIRKTYPNVEVVIFSDKASPDTTGDGAAGVWGPFCTSETPEYDILRWSRATYNYLADIATSEDGPKAGVYFELFYTVTSELSMEIPFFHSIPFSFHPMDAKELSMFPNARSGYSYTTIISQGTFIIQYIEKRYLEAGGKMVRRSVNNLDELSSDGFDIVVNCSGLGALDLCNDPSVFPIRGQIHKVEAPWLKFGMDFAEGDFYIIPLMDKVVLGGTHEEDNWSTEVNKMDKHKILEGCSLNVPSLKNAKRVNDWVGLRPGRTELRLEKEICINQNNGNKYTVVHNYGHGGAGLTLFWGTAGETLDLLKVDLDSKNMAKL